MPFALESQSQLFVISAGRFVVGRGSDVDLALADESVSRRHAVFRIEGDQPFIEDLRSRNGTLVNGRATAGKVRLAVGDRIVFGNREFRLIQTAGTELAPERATAPLPRIPEYGDRSSAVTCPPAAPDALKKLSPREREVFVLLARGCSQREIAGQFGVSIKTIETHRTRIGRKLGARNRAELVRCALEGGLLRPDTQ